MIKAIIYAIRQWWNKIQNPNKKFGKDIKCIHNLWVGKKCRSCKRLINTFK